MQVHTERLCIRDFQPEDWSAVLKYTSDPEVMKYIPEGVFAEQEAKDFIRDNIEQAENFPVIFKDEHALIGHMVFHKWFGEGTYEIGWVFHPEYHHRGLASEAARALLQHCFEKLLNAHRVIATCQPQNTASYRVMEKIGMRREAHFKKCIPAHYKQGSGEWWAEYFYAILEEEWLPDTGNVIVR